MYKLEQKLIHGQLVNVKVYPAGHPRYAWWGRQLSVCPVTPTDTEPQRLTDDTCVAVDKQLRNLMRGVVSCY